MKTPARKLDQYIVRFPDGMRDRLKEEASANNRSLNAEIIARLEASFDAPGRDEFEAMKKWATEFLRVALDKAVDEIVSEAKSER